MYKIYLGTRQAVYSDIQLFIYCITITHTYTHTHTHTHTHSYIQICITTIILYALYTHNYIDDTTMITTMNTLWILVAMW